MVDFEDAVGCIRWYTYRWLSERYHLYFIAPAQPPSLKQAMVWIAKLGGFLARKNDGEPGVKSLWRGLKRGASHFCKCILEGNGGIELKGMR